MCVACADLGWVVVARILEDQTSTHPKSICYFVFVILFIYIFLCPNIEQPRLSIDHL
jgi:hypothetical protein